MLASADVSGRPLTVQVEVPPMATGEPLLVKLRHLFRHRNRPTLSVRVAVGSTISGHVLCMQTVPCPLTRAVRDLPVTVGPGETVICITFFVLTALVLLIIILFVLSIRVVLLVPGKLDKCTVPLLTTRPMLWKSGSTPEHAGRRDWLTGI